MNDIKLYYALSKGEIFKERKTAEGKLYTINHPRELVVDMRYLGRQKASANSQGWERNSNYYFKQIWDEHPDYFSKKNTLLVKSGRSPIVDTKFVSCFPQYADFLGETLVHHHIGQDGQAVALPQSIHKGFGEIHTIENELEITNRAKEFSTKCEELSLRNPDLQNNTSEVFYSMINDYKHNKGNAFDEAVKTENKNAVKQRNAFSEAKEQQNVTHLHNNAFNHSIAKADNERAPMTKNELIREYKSLRNEVEKARAYYGNGSNEGEGQASHNASLKNQMGNKYRDSGARTSSESNNQQITVSNQSTFNENKTNNEGQTKTMSLRRR